MLAGGHGETTAEGIRLKLHLPQETLAHLTAATRQRINQVLKEWEASGLVGQQYGELVLLDPVALEALTRET
ncbi:Crp-like helix-turn-helix domain protein [compost metagenome]